jgi:TolB protein
MRMLILFLIVVVTFMLGCSQKQNDITKDPYKFVKENHLSNLQMLTDQGENAEAYFSPDAKSLIFQSRHGDFNCDQIFTMNIDGSDKILVSTGDGRTTCSFFYPDRKKIIYASTHGADKNCPPAADYSQGYVWKVYRTFELYIANADGTEPKVVVPHDGYDAEATVSPQGDKVVFN